MKKIFPFLVIAIFLALIAGCSDDESENIIETSLIINTDPTSPLLLSSKLDSNETLEVYGIRDANGLPTAINQMYLLDKSSGQETIYILDDSGRVGYIQAYDGTVLKLDWSQNSIDLTVIGESKQSFFKTSVDLTNGFGKTTINKTHAKNQAIEGKIISNNTKNIQVNLSRCGKPANFEGVVRIETEIAGNPLIKGYLKKTDIGIYSGQISIPGFPPITPGQLCPVLEPLIGDLCEIYSPTGSTIDTTLLGDAICTQIGAYITATGAVPVGIGAGALCVAINRFFTLACGFNNLCGVAGFENFSLTGQFPIRAVLQGPDGDFIGSWVDVDFTQPISTTLEVNLGDSYIHLVELSAPLLNCDSNWNAFVNGINLGPISADFPLFTTVPSGLNSIYLSDGVQFSEGWLEQIPLPCEATETETAISFEVECEQDLLAILISRDWNFSPNIFNYNHICYSSDGTSNSSGEDSDSGPEALSFNEDYVVYSPTFVNDVCDTGTNTFSIDGNNLNFTINSSCYNSLQQRTYNFSGVYDDSTNSIVGFGIFNLTNYYTNGQLQCQFNGIKTNMILE